MDAMTNITSPAAAYAAQPSATAAPLPPAPAVAAPAVAAPATSVKAPALPAALLDAPCATPAAQAAAIAQLPPNIRYAPSGAPHEAHRAPTFESVA